MTSIHEVKPAWNWRLRERYGHLGVGESAAAPGEINTEGRPKGSLFDIFDIRLLKVGPGAATAEMHLKQVHMNQRGITQAGAVVVLADAAAGWATIPALAEDMQFTTLELKMNMLRVSRIGDILRAEVTPVHVGSTAIVLDVLIFRPNAQGKPVAKFSCTQLVLRQRSEKQGGQEKPSV